MKDHLFKRWEWFVERAEGHHARFWLVVIAFTESSLFLIPPDVLLVAILIARGERWMYYATLTTVASVAGALFGYAIGMFFYDTIGIQILSAYGLLDKMEFVRTQFSNDTFLVILFTAFTPIPFKIFTLIGGFLHVNVIAFTLAALLGRGARFFLVAYIARTVGEIGWKKYEAMMPYALAISIVLFVAFVAYRLLM
jgi:membrane protein YqaA with SNARE-associated domain